VIETVRKNDGWWDVNIDKSVVDMAKSHDAGDGVFYVVVRDGFGRERRFDLAYVKWTFLVNDDPPIKYSCVYNLKRNKWWDSNSSGTRLDAEGRWSTDVGANIFWTWGSEN
jgi:hypothetical protein